MGEETGLLTVTSGTLGVAQRKRLRPKRLLARAWFLSKCAVLLALCATMAWGGYTVYRLVREAQYFRLRTIHIAGHSLLSRQEVLYLLAIPAGVSLFQLDLARMGARLERHPQVKSVTIRRQFPNALQVTVQERMPHLVIVSGSQRVVVDRDGVVLRAVIPGRDAVLPQLVLHRKRALTPGMHLNQAKVQRALELMQVYKTSAVAATLRVVALTVEDTGTSRWTVEPYPFPIRFGEGRIDMQLKRLFPVLRYITQQGLAVRLVDASYRKRIVVIPES